MQDQINSMWLGSWCYLCVLMHPVQNLFGWVKEVQGSHASSHNQKVLSSALHVQAMLPRRAVGLQQLDEGLQAAQERVSPLWRGGVAAQVPGHAALLPGKCAAHALTAT